jgi:hemerythrin-like domain-containing protein
VDPLQELEEEHRLIERALDAVEAAAGRSVDLGFYEKVLELLAAFAERCHHAKEEDLLFPLLERRGVPRAGGPLGILLSEHRIGRGTLRRLRELLASGNREELRRSSLEYAAFVREHVRKEEALLFPEGRTRFSEADLEALGRSFREVEKTGEERARCAALVRELLAEVERVEGR